MDIQSIRQQLKNQTIYEIPLRVTYYARVSGGSDKPQHEDFIKKNAPWTFIPGYIDDGTANISAKKCENFNRMVADGKAGSFDLIITDVLNRFARNTPESIAVTQNLLSAGVGVFFINDSINTLEEDSELRLTVMSGIAQDELHKSSSRIKFGHRQAIKKNVVFGNSRIFGYVKQDKRLVIDEAEAVMVRELYKLYATGEYGMKQMEKMFWEKGYRNLKGNKIARSTLANIISNPKYKGYYVGGKVRAIDALIKKQKFLPPEEWVTFKDETGEIVPAIVSEELWSAANGVLKKRGENIKSRQGVSDPVNLLTGKLICASCGTAYYLRRSRHKHKSKSNKWICSGKIKNGFNSCESFDIYEDDIKPLLFEAFKETENGAHALLEENIRMCNELDEENSLSERIAERERRVETITKKKSKLLEYSISGQISDKDFITMNKQCAGEIETAKQELMELEEQLSAKNELKKHIGDIRRILREISQSAERNTLNKEFVDKYIDKILVTPEDGDALKLEIKTFTGEKTIKYLKHLVERDGEKYLITRKTLISH